ncbi:MAG TPA: hypothetical protein VFM68_02490 [Candidatus Saccharimonadales bacterium]|nr:hypothetical protein [Candidatus Saccharimonadales bacterium]
MKGRRLTLDLNEFQNLPPVVIGVIIAIVGWVIKHFSKSKGWGVLGILLIVSGVVVVISELIGFPLLWTALAALLGLFEWFFTGLAMLCEAGRQALENL